MHSFVLPLSLHCTISIGAASCRLSHLSLSGYHCPVSYSLYCIGMMCGSPCSSSDYQTPTWFGPRPLVKSSPVLVYREHLSCPSMDKLSLLSQSYVVPFFIEGLAKGLARQEPLLLFHSTISAVQITGAYPSGSDIICSQNRITISLLKPILELIELYINSCLDQKVVLSDP